jgi:hypothetical protein
VQRRKESPVWTQIRYDRPDCWDHMGVQKAFSALVVFSLVLVFAAAAVSTCRAVTFGQIDNFEDGTTDHWANGGTAQPMNISSGGPTGVGDHFLQVTSDGNGATGRLTVFNRSQWLGDYIGAGLTEIDLELKNFGNTPLSIRLAFKSATFSGAPGYVSTTPFLLNSNSGWQHAVFLITPSAMTAVGGPSDFNAFFSGPAEFRIINATGTGDLNGDIVASQLGIDNIFVVPEPSSLILLMLAGILIWPFAAETDRRKRIR